MYDSNDASSQNFVDLWPTASMQSQRAQALEGFQLDLFMLTFTLKNDVGYDVGLASYYLLCRLVLACKTLQHPEHFFPLFCRSFQQRPLQCVQYFMLIYKSPGRCRISKHHHLSNDGDAHKCQSGATDVILCDDYLFYWCFANHALNVLILAFDRTLPYNGYAVVHVLLLPCIRMAHKCLIR